jgi:NAD(P)-dependent dehydrogenase (short-subunit alcohol dehydrogenase family)
MSFNLKGKNIVIIGGAGLIGREFTRQCLEHGATVVVAESNMKKVRTLLATLPTFKTQLMAERVDTTNEKSVRSLVTRLEKKLKHIDGLVNTAHFSTGKPGATPTEVEYKDFLDYLNDHIGGPFLAAREFAKHMMGHGGGSIVFMGSIYGIKAPRFEIYKGTPMTVRAEYEIAKAGLIQLTKHLAKQWGPNGIRVNTISPGGVFDNQNPKFVKAYTAHAVLGNRMAHPDDIAPALVYLISEAGKYVTGQNIIIDGGWTL